MAKEGVGVMAQHVRGKNGATSNYTQIARLIFSAHTVKMLVKAGQGKKQHSGHPQSRVPLLGMAGREVF